MPPASSLAEVSSCSRSLGRGGFGRLRRHASSRSRATRASASRSASSRSAAVRAATQAAGSSPSRLIAMPAAAVLARALQAFHQSSPGGSANPPSSTSTARVLRGLRPSSPPPRRSTPRAAGQGVLELGGEHFEGHGKLCAVAAQPRRCEVESGVLLHTPEATRSGRLGTPSDPAGARPRSRRRAPTPRSGRYYALPIRWSTLLRSARRTRTASASRRSCASTCSPAGCARRSSRSVSAAAYDARDPRRARGAEATTCR